MDFLKDKEVLVCFSYDLKNEEENLSSKNKDHSVSLNRNYPEVFHLVDYIENIELPKNTTSKIAVVKYLIN